MVSSLIFEISRLILATDQTTQIENYIAGIINSVVDIALVIGLAAGIAGIVLYIMIGILQMQVFTGLFAGGAGRRIWEGLEISITIPVIIAILYTLDAMAKQGMFGTYTDTGTMGWMIDQIWLYISRRLSDIFGMLTGSSSTIVPLRVEGYINSAIEILSLLF